MQENFKNEVALQVAKHEAKDLIIWSWKHIIGFTVLKLICQISQEAASRLWRF